MDEDGIKDAAAQVRSRIKQAVGKITGETATQADGAAEKATVEAESAAGDAKNAASKTAKDGMTRPRARNERRTLNR